MAKPRSRMREFPDLLSKLESGSGSMVDLWECVFRNVGQLFGARLGPEGKELETLTYARNSICRFGVRDPSGPVGGPSDYAEHLAQAIRVHEPRLVAKTVSVRYIEPPPQVSQSRWLFRVEGLLWPECAGHCFRCLAAFDLMEGRATLVR